MKTASTPPRRHFVFGFALAATLVATLFASTSSHAQLPPTSVDERSDDAFVGWSNSTQQFAVRRTMHFSLTGRGKDLPGVFVPQPMSMDVPVPQSDDFTCGDFCKAKGFPCTDKEWNELPVVRFAPSNVDGRAKTCTDRVIPVARAAARGSTFKELGEPARIECDCLTPQQARTFTGMPSWLSLTFVELYDVSGKLGATFLENERELPLFDKLKNDPSVSPEFEAVLKRDIGSPAKLRATLTSGGFDIPKPTGKHPAGKCVVSLDPGTLVFSHDDIPVREVVLGIKTPTGNVSLYESRFFEQKPATFQAWWLPVKPAVLVGVLHSAHEDTKFDRLIVARDGLAACDER